MTPRCTNCLHWDEESADVVGMGICGDPGLDNWIHEGTGLRMHVLRTRGDDGCRHFSPKRVSPAPTHPSSEADKP